MQNKAKFKKVKFYISKDMIKDYEQMDTWCDRKKQSQTNPNKPKFKKAKMNVNNVLTKGYEKMSSWAIYPKRTQNEPNLSRRSRIKPNLPASRRVLEKACMTFETYSLNEGRKEARYSTRPEAPRRTPPTKS